IEVRSSGASAPSDLAAKEGAHAGGSGSSHAPRIEDLNADRGSSRNSGSGGLPRKGGQIEPPPTPEIDRQLAAKLAADSSEASGGADPAVDPDFDSAMLEANKLYD